MAKMSLEEEIASLKEEVERLKKKEADASKGELQKDDVLDTLAKGADEFEGELEAKAEEVIARMKLDYENMSPATAIAIFSAGAMFGRLFLSK